MRARFWVPHHLGNSVLKFFGYVMFETLCLVVHFVLLEAQVLHKPAFDEPMVADYLQRYTFARGRERGAVVRLMLYPAALPEESKHLADRRLAGLQMVRELLGSCRLLIVRERVNRLDIVLRRFGHTAI